MSARVFHVLVLSMSYCNILLTCDWLVTDLHNVTEMLYILRLMYSFVHRICPVFTDS